MEKEAGVGAPKSNKLLGKSYRTSTTKVSPEKVIEKRLRTVRKKIEHHEKALKDLEQEESAALEQIEALKREIEHSEPLISQPIAAH